VFQGVGHELVYHDKRTPVDLPTAVKWSARLKLPVVGLLTD